MSHFLLLVVGGEVDEQLAIYSTKLQVAAFPERLSDSEIARMQASCGVDADDIEDTVECIRDWVGFDGGHDDDGYFYWSSINPRGKFDWCVMGGRWCGYLCLREGAFGEVGKRGAGVPDDAPLPYGALSADRALFGDIDWDAMRRRLADEAADEWEEFQIAVSMGWDNAFKYGVESGWTEQDYVRERSHPASFAVLKDSEWYQRAENGWWGVMLDAPPVSEWHDRWDEIMSDCSPDTLLTVVDCHITGGPG